MSDWLARLTAREEDGGTLTFVLGAGGGWSSPDPDGAELADTLNLLYDLRRNSSPSLGYPGAYAATKAAEWLKALGFSAVDAEFPPRLPDPPGTVY